MLTQNAVDAIAALKESSEEVPETASLRIAAQLVSETDASFELALVDGPEAEDTIVEAQEEQVFLEPVAASILDDKVLDAEMEEGRIRFAVAPQASLDGDGPAE